MRLLTVFILLLVTLIGCRDEIQSNESSALLRQALLMDELDLSMSIFGDDSNWSPPVLLRKSKCRELLTLLSECEVIRPSKHVTAFSPLAPYVVLDSKLSSDAMQIEILGSGNVIRIQIADKTEVLDSEAINGTLFELLQISERVGSKNSSNELTNEGGE